MEVSAREISKLWPFLSAHYFKSIDPSEAVSDGIEIVPVKRPFTTTPNSFRDVSRLYVWRHANSQILNLTLSTGTEQKTCALELPVHSSERIVNAMQNNLMFINFRDDLLRPTLSFPQDMANQNNIDLLSDGEEGKNVLQKSRTQINKKQRVQNQRKSSNPTSSRDKRTKRAKDESNTCHLCGKIMKKSSLTAHLRLVHDGENHRIHSCRDCGRSYKTKAALVKHRITHTGERPFCCSKCGRTYKENDSWLNCQRRCSGNFRHACSYCPKMFNSKFKLNNHLMIHTGVKPFHCPMCSYQCTRKDNLQTHARKQHKMSLEEVNTELEQSLC